MMAQSLLQNCICLPLLLTFISGCVSAQGSQKNAQSDSLQKFQEMQKRSKPLLETYWESYLSFPYNYSNMCINDLNPYPVDVFAYGYDIKDVPEGVDIVNIAFASPHVYRYKFLSTLFPVVTPKPQVSIKNHLVDKTTSELLTTEFSTTELLITDLWKTNPFTTEI